MTSSILDVQQPGDAAGLCPTARAGHAERLQIRLNLRPPQFSGQPLRLRPVAAGDEGVQRLIALPRLTSPRPDDARCETAGAVRRPGDLERREAVRPNA